MVFYRFPLTNRYRPVYCPLEPNKLENSGIIVAKKAFEKPSQRLVRMLLIFRDIYQSTNQE